MGWARQRALAAVAVLVAFIGGSAHAQGVVDQQTTCNDGGSAQIRFYEPIAQRFTPTAPNLIAVELLLGRFNPPYSDTLTMRIAEDSIGGAFVAAVSSFVSAGPAYGWHRFDLAAPVLVAPGVPYVIELDATNPALGWAHQYELPPRCTYPGGEEIVSGVPVAGLDAAFRTYTLCGNGTRDLGEECDDGNRIDTDGCTNRCTVCGDGAMGAGDECDDGNIVSGDGCDANCTLTACGNGITTAGETCDDGNRSGGDCCSPVCQWEAYGTSCADDGNECTNDVCDGTGTCNHPPNMAPCSDGNLCDGADFCSGGTCSVHSGNPCADEPVCARTCVQTSSLQYACSVDPAGTACPSDGLTCTSDVCNGAGACTHPTAPNGSTCEDGDRCTTGDTCQAGVCRSGTSTPCDPCLACEAQTGACVVPQAPGCFPAATGRSSIVLRHGVTTAATDKVVWRWRGLADFDKAALGAPASGTGYTLCVFDQTSLRLSATAPAGDACAGKPCWRDLPNGYRYADPDGTPDGLQKVQTRAGRASQAKITVKGRGARLDLHPLGLATPVTVRLRRSDDGACWESSYSVPTASDDVQFKAKSD
jgi:cysteine-rich repeat protein